MSSGSLSRARDLAPRSPRRPTGMDRVRVREFLRRVDAGEDELDAFWAVASDAGTGYQRYRGVTVRPPKFELQRKLHALLLRAAPGIVAGARSFALTRLASLSDEALRTVAEIVSGDFTDGHVARARLEAARLILGSIGVRGDGVAATVATQVNVSPVMSFGDVIRAARCIDEEGVQIDLPTP